MVRKKVVITGAGGFVGSNVLSLVLNRHHCIGVDLNSPGRNLPSVDQNVDWYSADITDHRQMLKLIDTVRPDVIVHTAAAADVDYCENNKTAAAAVNTESVKYLIDMCTQRQIHIIFFSTDTVFDGKKGWYGEYDAPNPVNYYAETKIAAENLVCAYQGPWTIFRLSLVFGLTRFGGGNSFLSRMLDQLMNSQKVYFPSLEVRTPAYVNMIAGCVVESLERQITGLYHLAGNNSMGRLEMARIIAKNLGFDQNLVRDSSEKPVISESEKGETITRANRPLDVSLRNEKAKETFSVHFPDFTEAVNDIKGLLFSKHSSL
ncbi:MAG: SDR family oxidoreductase [Spirochaetia bacterium]|nr:SDR family oxidoreductase [Spirochaetia bacterium]